MLVLGIETSCDETAAAVLKDDKLLSNIVFTQMIHEEYQGVVPELASRAHIVYIRKVIDKALKEAGVKYSDLDGIAVTHGPGLVGALLVGLSVAKSMAYSLNIPYIGVNHMEGHLFATMLSEKVNFPAIALIISGGHTMLLYVEAPGKYKLLGQTRDDAVGEAWDKVAKLLGLGYPGGVKIDNLAKDGDVNFVDFPKGLYHSKDYDFSFSGLKTAVLNYISTQDIDFVRENIAHICASFQKSVVDVLSKKAFNAVKEYKVNQLIFGGGVSRNSYLRYRFMKEAKRKKIDIAFPIPDFCTDNAAMIAYAGMTKLKNGEISDLNLNAIPNLKLV